MRLFLLLAVLTPVWLQAAAPTFTAVPNWYHLPPDRPQIGNQHGDVAVSAAGEIYISTMDPKAPMQVYGADGKYLRAIMDCPDDFHGFVIHKEDDGEFIFGPRLRTGDILKLTLDGKTVLSVPASTIPDEFKSKGKAGTPGVKLTAMDVAPNGDWYVTDGYSSDFVHHFDKGGKYLNSFGGKGEPYNFKTLHKLAVDTRFTPARLIACDRANNRVVHLSLDGQLLGVVIGDLRLPAAVAVQGDYAVIGELKGRVTLLDKEGKVVTQFGENTNADEIGSNKTEPDKWRPGIVTAPHGVTFDAKGNVYVSEYSLFGRVHRFDRK